MKYQFPMFVWAGWQKMMSLLLRPFGIVKSYLLCMAYGVKCMRPLPRFIGRTILRTRKIGEITIGRGVLFDASVEHNLVGLSNPTILDTRRGGFIVIGDDSGFSSVIMSSKAGIKIGERVKCGGNVRIFDHDFHSLSSETRANPIQDQENVRSRPISIGDDVFIGTNAIILKGTTIGARSIIAAGSVVFGLSIPSDSMVKGNPAKIIRRAE